MTNLASGYFTRPTLYGVEHYSKEYDEIPHAIHKMANSNVQASTEWLLSP